MLTLEEGLVLAVVDLGDVDRASERDREMAGYGRSPEDSGPVTEHLFSGNRR